MDKMKIAYSYVRVSSGKQAGTGKDGLNRQVRLAETWAKENGYTLSERSFFRDAGKSAYKGANLRADSSLSAFLAACDRGEIQPGSVLIVEAIDRISRADILTAQKLFMSVLDRGIEIVTVLDKKRFSRETVNSLDLITSLLLFEAAHKYSKNLGERVAEAWKRKRETGGKNNRHPFWIRSGKNGYEVIPEKSEIIRKIFRLYLTDMGYPGVTRRLNEEGIPCAQVRAKAWTSGMVRHFLVSPTVIGEYHAFKSGANKEKIETGIVHKNYYPPIISEEDYHAVQIKLMKASRPTAGRRPKAENNLWAGLMKCGYCGGTMGVEKDSKLVCWKSKQGGCIPVSWDVSDYEVNLLFSCREAIEDRRKELTRPDSIEISKIEDEIELTTKKIKKAMQLREDIPDLPEAVEDIRNLHEKRKGLEKARDTLVKQMDDFVGQEIAMGEILILNNQEERSDMRRLLRKNISSIIVYPIGDKKKIWDKFKQKYPNLGGWPLLSRYEKENDLEQDKYMRIYPVSPVTRNGTKVEYFDVFSMERMEESDTKELTTYAEQLGDLRNT